MIGLCNLMAGDDFRMTGGESHMTGGESRMTGDCCRPEGSIHRCVRTHSHLYSNIYGLVALLDNIQSSFSKYHYLNSRKGPKSLRGWGLSLRQMETQQLKWQHLALMSLTSNGSSQSFWKKARNGRYRRRPPDSYEVPG